MDLRNHLEKLVAFKAVADAGSISGGAQKVHRTQPTVSQAIKALEGELDRRLFARGYAGVELTDAGKELAALCDRIFAEVDRFAFDWTERGHTVRIGTKETLGASFLPAVLAVVREKFPQVNVRISLSRYNRTLLSDLDTGRLDLLLIPKPFTSPAVKTVDLCVETMGIYARSESDLELPFLLFGDGYFREGETLRELFARDATERVIEVESFLAARTMAEAGLGVAVLPRSFVKGAALVDISKHLGVPEGSIPLVLAMQSAANDLVGRVAGAISAAFANGAGA